MKDKDKGESKGFAFITFTTNDTAQKAIEEVHDKEFKVLSWQQSRVYIPIWANIIRASNTYIF